MEWLAQEVEERRQQHDWLMSQRLSRIEGKLDAALYKLDSAPSAPKLSPREKISTGIFNPESMPWAKMGAALLILRYLEQGGDLKTAIGAFLKLALGS